MKTNYYQKPQISVEDQIKLQNSKNFKTNSTFEAAYALYKFVATDLIKYYTFFGSGNLLNN